MRLLTITLILLLASAAYGQDRCGTVEFTKWRELQNPRLESIDQFENWMSGKLRSPRKSAQRFHQTQSTYTIPVVVHVIHNGEPVGTGTNISDAQIQSQISVLNEDFKRLNADATNTPAQFQSVAGTMDVEFVLALQDPEGLATTGIVRVQGTKPSWQQADDYQLKSLSYWRSDRYLNIWVCNLIDTKGIVGYGQFPVSALPGLEESSNDALTDGIVLHYDVTGSIDDGPFVLDPKFNKGRTATHEVGHFLGLRHIWGDVNNCLGTDYVDDTPPQSGPTTNCPSHPQVVCFGNKMFQNYLDYTDDACMNLFTVQQVARMDVVINNSPRRASLLTSPGSVPPTVVANDLGIRSIVNPATSACVGMVTPQIEVRNYGSNTITSFSIRVSVNGNAQYTNFTQTLNPLDAANLFLPPMALAAGASLVEFEVLGVNGVSDNKATNNYQSLAVLTTAAVSPPLVETFSGSLPSNWQVQNPDGLTTWQIVAANNGFGGNEAIRLNFYDYENEGAVDMLVLPPVNLTASAQALLQFDIAYAPYPGQPNDRLQVLVSTECSKSGSLVVFDKSASALQTAPQTSSNFSPSGATQWRTESINLGAYLGQPQVQLRFKATNGFGNNLFLDNIRIVTGSFLDVALEQINRPTRLSCESNVSPELLIRNQGSETINSVRAAIQINQGAVVNQTISSLNLGTGQSMTLALAPLSLPPGSNTISVTVDQPNGLMDDVPQNNSVTRPAIVDGRGEPIPLRQNFESASNWRVATDGTEAGWATASANLGSSMRYPGFTNVLTGNQSWLVSPALDFSRAFEASVFFDISYALRSPGVERLQVLVSHDCGVTYPDILLDETGEQFATRQSPAEWVPALTSDWAKRYLNLNNYAQQQNIRLAWVVFNGNGNNLYVDNIELFQDDEINPPRIDALYALYPGTPEFRITFNLPERSAVRLQVLNLMGQSLADLEYPDTLNQTYFFDLGNAASGIYIVRIQIGNQLFGEKIFLSGN